MGSPHRRSGVRCCCSRSLRQAGSVRYLKESTSECAPEGLWNNSGRRVLLGCEVSAARATQRCSIDERGLFGVRLCLAPTGLETVWAGSWDVALGWGRSPRWGWRPREPVDPAVAGPRVERVFGLETKAARWSRGRRAKG